jgi:hypothetical protein
MEARASRRGGILSASSSSPSMRVPVSSSSATPSKAQVEAAKAKLDALNRQLDQMVEQYNQAQVRLQQTQAKLLDAKQAKDAADAINARATSELSKRAVAAYTGMGSQLDVLLGPRASRSSPTVSSSWGARPGRRRPRRAGAAEPSHSGRAACPGRDGAPGHAEQVANQKPIEAASPTRRPSTPR